MKLAQILLACVVGCLITTPVLAGGFCVAENGGCRDIQTGKLYVPDGNKLVDPETKQVYTENAPVEINSSNVNTPRASGNVIPGWLRDPRTGLIIPQGKQIKVKETEEMDIRGDVWGTATRKYSRATTCQGLKSEIDGLNREWSELKSWNRAAVNKRIDKLEAEYQEQCQ